MQKILSRQAEILNGFPIFFKFENNFSLSYETK